MLASTAAHYNPQRLKGQSVRAAHLDRGLIQHAGPRGLLGLRNTVVHALGRFEIALAFDVAQETKRSTAHTGRTMAWPKQETNHGFEGLSECRANKEWNIQRIRHREKLILIQGLRPLFFRGSFAFKVEPTPAFPVTNWDGLLLAVFPGCFKLFSWHHHDTTGQQDFLFF